jgi:competence/damage-inducible protein CinA-like protein
VQAMFPAGSEPLRNERGTAPGIWMPLASPPAPWSQGVGGEGLSPGAIGSSSAAKRVLFVALPGVPGEMMPMFEKEVRPRLRQMFPGLGVVVEHKINCFGAGESAVEEKLLDLTRRGHQPEVGITVSDANISLRILAHAADTAAAEAIIAPVEKVIRERLGDLVFGTGDEDLQHVVAKLLMEKKLTIATAESITGGLIASRLTDVPGISAHLMGGVVAYDNSIKRDLLGVPQELLDQHGAVSPQVAEAMAKGCRERFGVDIAVSTTGIAGPSGATPTKPVGLVYVGLATADGVKSYKYNWFGTRQEVQSRTAKMALNVVRLALIGRLRARAP